MPSCRTVSGKTARNQCNPVGARQHVCPKPDCYQLTNHKIWYYIKVPLTLSTSWFSREMPSAILNDVTISVKWHKISRFFDCFILISLRWSDAVFFQMADEIWWNIAGLQEERSINGIFTQLYSKTEQFVLLISLNMRTACILLWFVTGLFWFVTGRFITGPSWFVTGPFWFVTGDL